MRQNNHLHPFFSPADSVFVHNHNNISTHRCLDVTACSDRLVTNHLPVIVYGLLCCIGNAATLENEYLFACLCLFLLNITLASMKLAIPGSPG